MSEKEKLKNKPTEQEYAPFWMYGVFVILLLITSVFPLFHILNAYAHTHEYRSLAWSTLRGFGFILCVVIIIGIYLQTETKQKWKLGIFVGIVGYATIFHDGIGLMIIGILFAPLSVPVFPIYLGGLLLMRITTRRIYLREMVALIGIGIVFAFAIITLTWYMSAPYNAIHHHTFNNRSYNLVVDSAYFDPTVIKLYKCDQIGLFCESIYTSDENLEYYDGDIRWEISEDRAKITIIVNDEVIHTYELTSISD